MFFRESDQVTVQFQHRETKVWFDARPCTHEFGLQHGFTHEVCVDTRGIAGDYGFRFAEVKKTVAYMAVDEDEFGQPVIEAWPIKTLWRR